MLVLAHVLPETAFFLKSDLSIESYGPLISLFDI